MWTSAESVLEQAATSTFEQVAFTLLDRSAGAAAEVDAARHVEFSGPADGRLVLRVSGGILPAIAANMLGDVSMPTTEVQLDALGELANIICGNLVPALGFEAGLYRLQLRPVGHVERADSAVMIAAACFSADGGSVECLLYATPAAQ